MKRILRICALIIIAASSCACAESSKIKKPSQNAKCHSEGRKPLPMSKVEGEESQANRKYQIYNLKSHKKSSQTDPNTCPEKKQTAKASEVDEILARLHQSAARLKSYQAKIRYLFIQEPELLDSRTLRKGELFYKKDTSGSKLRVNFNTLRQDDSQEEKYIEHFIFDGVWLTKIDFQLEKINFYQQAPEEKPIDVFEFISHRFPLLGFTNIQLLRKNFDITLILPKEAKSGDYKGLRLIPKKNSIYKNDYAHISFWLDTASLLPAQIEAESTEGDIYDIKLLESRVNKKNKNVVFKLETPKHFSQNRTTLNRK